tara:strand:- start:21489 stop:21938 length:450 start_codon:yes stop_codon:yes gene_type:complete
MEISVFVEINRPVPQVWDAIIDFKNCSNYMESITEIKVLEEPKDTLVGFKWIETRVMFGKEATETMWITDYTENQFYQTRAESHGSVYVSKLTVAPSGEFTKLSMSLTTKAQTLPVKIFSTCLGFLFKSPMKKALLKDLNDIKTYLESK